MTTLDKYGDEKTFGMIVDGSLDEFIYDEPISTIGDYMFSHMPNLSVFDVSVQRISGHAFYGDSALESVNFEAVTSIGTEAFKGTNLKGITLPLVTELKGSAFESCENLESVDAPKCTSASSGAIFRNCKKLNNVNLPVLTYIYGDEFRRCSSLEKIILPLSNQVSSYMFYEAEALKWIDLPSATVIARSYAFYKIHEEAIIILRHSSVVTLADTNSYIGINQHKIYVPDELVEDYKSATNWSTIASKIYPISELPEEE